MVEQFFKGGQEGWCHDQSDWSGFFHSYPYFQEADPLNQPRKIHVFLPREYEVTDQAYPVIYMNDGNTAFFKGGIYQKTWNMAYVLTRLYVSQSIPKVIVVAVSPLHRDYEYTHAPLKGQDWGGLDDYSTYLAQSVKGFIDQHYRTLPESHKTLILGASYGGLAAFYTAMKYPDKFGGIAALSPAFWVGLDLVTERSKFDFFDTYFGSLDTSALMGMSNKTLSHPQLKPKIYLDWGLVRSGGEHNAIIEERTTARGKEMQGLLTHQFGYQENYNLCVVEDPAGEHNEESWSRRVETALKFFYG